MLAMQTGYQYHDMVIYQSPSQVVLTSRGTG